MKVNIQSVNFNAHEPLIEYVDKKLSKLDLLYDKMIAIHAHLKADNNSEKNNKHAEIRLEIPGDDIVVKKSGQSFEECIDLSVDALKKSIIKRKEKEAELAR